MLELRAFGTLEANGKTLTGYAAVFNTEAALAGFSEVIRPGAFAKTLAMGSNVPALWHHKSDALLATTRAKTLLLREDDKGLAFKMTLPDTTHGRDLAALVERGDVAGCSFGFVVRPGGERWSKTSGKLVRELLALDLKEITLTHDPAYADTSVALRSRDALIAAADTRKLWIETV